MGLGIPKFQKDSMKKEIKFKYQTICASALFQKESSNSTGISLEILQILLNH